MDTAALTLLIDVARHGSFAAAARAQGLDPSAVSRSIAATEASLGFRIFQRSTRRLAVTEAGKTYLDQIAPLLEGLTAARDTALAGERAPEGQVRLTASVAFG
ncbi:MAG: LysR family transcriptional regulator, partial [Pseudomonadota bacterium]